MIRAGLRHRRCLECLSPVVLRLVSRDAIRRVVRSRVGPGLHPRASQLLFRLARVAVRGGMVSLIA